MDSEKSSLAVAILIPTLNRTHLLKPLVENIRKATPQPHEIYFMTSNEDSKQAIAAAGAKVFDDVGATDLITRTNALYRLTSEPYIFTGSDDMYFHDGWLPPMLELMRQGYDVVVPDDMLNPNGTQALISRTYVQERSCSPDVQNVVFHPEYKHDYAETEQFEVAKKRGVFARCMESRVEHKHWANNKAVRDADYLISEHNSKGAAALFESRRHLWQ